MEKVCENCKRRKAYKEAFFCSVCGLSSEYETDAEVQKSPALDGLNRWLNWNRTYIVELELDNANKDKAVRSLICENKLSKNKYCCQLGNGMECQVCEIKRKVLGE